MLKQATFAFLDRSLYFIAFTYSGVNEILLNLFFTTENVPLATFFVFKMSQFDDSSPAKNTYFTDALQILLIFLHSSHMMVHTVCGYILSNLLPFITSNVFNSY